MDVVVDHVAGVGQTVVVGVDHPRHRLQDRNAGRVIDRGRRRRRLRVGLVAVRRRGVGDVVRPRRIVDVRLQERVARRQVLEPADRQRRRAHRIAGQRIGHRHAGQRHVAGVRHMDVVVDHVAGVGLAVAVCVDHPRHRLQDRQTRIRLPAEADIADGDRIGDRGAVRGRGHGHGVGVVDAAAERGCGHDAGHFRLAGEQRGAAQNEIQRRRIVRHDDIGVGDVAGVGDDNHVFDRVAKVRVRVSRHELADRDAGFGADGRRVVIGVAGDDVVVPGRSAVDRDELLDVDCQVCRPSSDR